MEPEDKFWNKLNQIIGKKELYILRRFGYRIDEECKDFAINHMVPNDFVKIIDANGQITEGVKVTRDDESQMYTVKKSCQDKYNDFYNEKLEHMIGEILKNK